MYISILEMQVNICDVTSTCRVSQNNILKNGLK